MPQPGALSTLIALGRQELTVVDGDDHPVGRLTLQRVLAEGSDGSSEKD